MNTIELKDFKVDLPLRSKAGETKVVSPSTEVQIIVPSDVAHELTSVTVEGIKTESKTVRSGAEEQIISPSDGKFIDEVIVQPITLQEKSVTPTTDEVVVLPDDEFVGLTKVTVEAVNPVDYQKPEESKAVTPTTEKQVITPSNGAVFSSVTVEAVDPSDYYKIEETTTIVPSESEQVVTPSEGNVFGSVTVSAIQTEEKTVTANGEVTPSSGKYLSKVTVAVPDNSADAKPEVGIIITPKKEQQVVTPTGNNVFNSVTVEKIPDEYIIPTGTKSITENGTHIVTEYANVEVNVEGLVPSGTKTITENGTYDITEFASAEVNVPSEEPTLVTKEITENGTYTASSDNADGYSSVTVNIAGSGGGDEALISFIEGTSPEFNVPSGTTKIVHSCFRGRSDLIKVSLPDSVSKIENLAFGDCNNMTDITMPDNAVSFPIITGNSGAFYGCNNLDNVYFKSVESILNNKYTVQAYNNPMAYNATAYLNGEPITEITIPSTMTKIENYQLYKFRTLTTINIPDSITSIGEYSFSYCEGVKHLNITNNVTSIALYAFENCTSLESITIPENITSLSNRICSNCKGLTEINFNAINCKDFSSAYHSCWQNAGRNATGITVNIGSKVTRIPKYLFRDSSTSYTANITKVKFAEGTVCTSIGSSAFYNCATLVEIDFSNFTAIPTLEASDAFSSINANCKMYVPDALYDDWIVATNWSTQASKIVKASEKPTE